MSFLIILMSMFVSTMSPMNYQIALDAEGRLYPVVEKGPDYSVFIMIILLIIVIIQIISFFRLFKKAGVSGWLAIIPICNLWTMAKLLKMRGWTIIFFAIPFIDIVYSIRFYYKMAKAYNRGFGMTLALIICPPVAMLIMAFSSKTKYVR